MSAARRSDGKLSPAPGRPPATAGAAPARAWLLFVHLLPPSPSNLRVRTWRRLQQIGALAVKQSVYVLPDSAAAREDLEWLKTEIEGAGGQASVFAADAVDSWSHDALVEEFRRTREEMYGKLAADAEQVLRRLGKTRKGGTPSRRALQQLRDRLGAIERVDFFGSAGRDRVAAILRDIDSRAASRPAAPPAAGDAGAPGVGKACLWVTRPRPGVDRMASAWLIRRFIDADARFDFAADRHAAPPQSIPFDMYGVEFTHRADQCTFEVLCDRFRLADPALAAIAAIVHDLDLKDARFGAPQAASVGQIIDGLRLAHADDHRLLSEGITLFEALYRTFAHAGRASGPRPVARRVAKPKRRR